MSNLSIPTWLNSDFFSKILKNYESDPDLTVSNFDIKPGVAAGVNFASLLLRVTLAYRLPKHEVSDRTLSLIVKVQPDAEGMRQDFINENAAFQTEIEMYQRVLPAVEKVLDSSEIKSKLFPKLIYSSLDPSPILILEDLKALSYQLIEGAADLTDTKLVARRIAQLHAATFYLSLNFDYSHFCNSVYNKKEGVKSPIEKYVIPGIQVYRRKFERFDSMEYAKVADALTILEQTIEGKVFEITGNAGAQEFNVLNHGDFSIRNMMFCNEGQERDVTFLDYQLCMWGTPSVDIFMLLYTVAAPKVRREFREEIIEEYYNEFRKSLKKFGYSKKIPTRLELNVELLRGGIFEAVIFLGICTMQFINPEEVDFVAVEENNDFTSINKIALKNPEYVEELMEVLRRLINQGNI